MSPLSEDQFPAPPVAKRLPKLLRAHLRERVDDYFWLRDRDDPDTMAYLKAENEYFKTVMGPRKPLEDALYKEMLARIQETDLSVPTRKDDYYYYARTEQGRQYSIYCRKRGSLEAAEQLILDGNKMAEGQKYFRLGNFATSPDHRLLAYSVDNSGDEEYETRIRDMETGQDLADLIPGTYYGLEWAADSQSFFYITQDEAKRPYRVHHHTVGHSPDMDRLVFEESDERFYVHLDKTSDDRYIVIRNDSFVTSENLVIRADLPAMAPLVLLPRRDEIEYSVDHHSIDQHRGYFYIRINDQGQEFRLVRTPETALDESHWVEILPNRPGIPLESAGLFRDYLVVTERHVGLERLRIQHLASGDWHEIEMPEPTYSVGLTGNAEFHTHLLRFQYTSMITPPSVFDYDMRTHERTLLKQTPVLGGYDPSQYVSERLFATSGDGTKIPISLVYRQGLARDGSAPCYLYGYGSYGISIDADFSSDTLTLLDRGFIYAIAHIRGGGELGKPWHDAGKLLVKKNTFDDFIASAEHLIATGYTAPGKVVAVGGSAGGMLVGTVMNMRPDLFGVIVAHVPFVDVLNTAQDPTLPLTIGEYEEWGNSTENRDVFDYIASYSPYDNVEAKEFPHLFITAGLNDPRVSYWEPAKWVAKLRRLKRGQHVIAMKVNMGAGHSGASGRYESLRETAEEFAFLLSAFGIEA